MGRLRKRSAKAWPEPGQVFLAGALVCALGACGEPTGPGDPDGPAGRLSVAVEVTGVTGPTLDPTSEAGQRITCGVSLQARATGVGRGRWGDAELFFFAGPDRDAALDSTPIPSDEIRGSWGGAEIGAGETRTSSWSIQASVPFAARFRYQYENIAGGATGTASTGFTCGPEIPPGAALPDITALSVESPPAVIQPGDSVIVQYAVSSGVGLWETAVVLSGACDVATVFPEPLSAGASRRVVVPIPPGCALGAPLTVGVAALDAGLQQRVRVWPTQFVLSDVTPPTIEPLFFLPMGGAATPVLDADYFDGDSVDVLFVAGDNHALRWLVWEALPGGFRDSVAVSGPGVAEPLKIAVRPEWAAGVQIQFTARDASNLTSAPVTTAPGAVRVYPTITRPTRTATVSGEIRDVVLDMPRGVAYLLQPNESRVAVFTLSSMSVGRTVATPGGAGDFDLTPGGDSLLLSLPNPRALGVIDLRQATPQVSLFPLTSLDTALAQGPGHLRAVANGKVFLGLGGNAAAALRLLEVDLATGVETRRTDAGDAGYVGGGTLERSFDFGTLVMNGGPELFQRYDAASNAFGPRGSAIPYDVKPVVDGAGQVVAISLDLYDASLQFQRRVQSLVSPIGVVPVALSPTDGHLYQAVVPWGILRSRTTDGRLVDRTRTGLAPTLLRVSPDGAVLVVVESNYGATSRISTIDLR